MSPKGYISYARLQQQRLFLIALVLGLLAVIFGIFLQIYQEQKTSQVDRVLRQMALPLNPTLDITSLDTVRGYELLTLEQIKLSLQNTPVTPVQTEEEIGEEIEEQLEENTLTEEEQLSDEELASFDQEAESLDETEEDLEDFETTDTSTDTSEEEL